MIDFAAFLITNQLMVPNIGKLYGNFTNDGLSVFMDTLNREHISCKPWPSFVSGCKASFAMAYTDDELILKYYVTENHLRALFHQTNDTVYKDSCVELFIALGGEKEYYNLEFNCLGVAKVAFGKHRNDRALLPENVIEQISRCTSLKSISLGNHSDFYWEIMLIIPNQVFCYHNISSFSGVTCNANFYKCGDDLLDPHFFSWNNIEAPDPDFHLPEFFGKICFTGLPAI